MEISFVCSLGNLCHSACILQDMKFKIESYPFDWVFSNFDVITHCLEDNFGTFLNKSCYIDIPKIKSKKVCGHRIYGPNMFYHRNPRLKCDYDYYLRCVSRFKQLLNKEDHKLFIIINVNMDNTDDNIKNSVIDFNLKLSKYTKNYTILYIWHIPSCSSATHTITQIDNIDFLELNTISRSNGTKFINNEDNNYLNTIIKNKYKFNIKNL